MPKPKSGKKTSITAKVDQTLREMIQAPAQRKADQSFPCIVTVKPGTDPAVLVQHGLQIENVIESISAVSGKATGDSVKSLAKLTQVERIEYDGEVRAIEGVGSKQQ